MQTNQTVCRSLYTGGMYNSCLSGFKPITSKRVPLTPFVIVATVMPTTYVYTTGFSGKSVEKILGKTDNSQNMLTP